MESRSDSGGRLRLCLPGIDLCHAIQAAAMLIEFGFDTLQFSDVCGDSAQPANPSQGIVQREAHDATEC